MENSQIKEEQEQKEKVTAESAPEAPAADQAAAEAADNELTKMKEELAGAKDKYVRLYSEFENFRRRTSKEKLEMIQSANEQLLRSLLPVADDFERAEKSIKEMSESDAEGFTLIHNKFKKVLELYGVKTMDVKPGTEFDTDRHDAITQMPAPDESLKGKIVDVVEKGYLLNDKVIRFAKVVVGS